MADSDFTTALQIATADAGIESQGLLGEHSDAEMEAPGMPFKHNDATNGDTAKNEPQENTQFLAELVSTPKYEKKVLTQTERRIKLLNTASLFAAFLAYGLCATPLGPALVDIKELLHTDTKSIVLAIIFRGAGSILGAFLVALLIGRVNFNLLILACSLGTTLSLAVMPWMPNLELFVSFACIQGIMYLALNTAAITYLFELWGHGKHGHSAMQAMQTAWSAAAMVSPLIIEPFLSKTVLPCSGNATVVDPYGTSVMNISEEYIVLDLKTNLSRPSYDENDAHCRVTETKVQYGFLTIACICLLAPIICIAAFIYEGKGMCMRRETAPQEKEKPRQTLFFRIVFVSVTAAFFSLHVSNELTIGDFIATFVIEGLHWDRWKGPIITTVYWGSFCMFRIVAIFLAHHISPKKLVFVCVTIIGISYSILAFSARLHDSIVWICMALIGGAEAPVVGAALALMNKVVTIDGVVSAVLNVANAAGVMLAATIIGHCIDQYGHMSMTYYYLCSSLTVIVLFSLMVLISSKCSCTESIEKVSELEVKDDCVEKAV